MGMLWYPGQDVDFLGRLDKVEKALKAIKPEYFTQSINSQSPYTITELEAENAELRLRVDDLEELVITLSEELGVLQARV